jgi:hypothetical protein
MEDAVRSGAASAEVHCMACDHTFAASLWQPRMCCPHCEVVGYPDQAGYNLIPLTWLCPQCEHENKGMTNFCLNCGEGQTTRCLRCEAPVYTTACTHCGTIQEPLLRRKRLRAQHEQRFHPIRSHVLAQQARLDPTPPPNSNPADVVTEWRPISLEPAPEEVTPPEEAAPPAPAPKTAATPAAAKPAKPQRKKRSWGDVGWGGLFWIAVGLTALFWDDISGFFEEGNTFEQVVTWFDVNVVGTIAGVVGAETAGPSVIILIVTGIVGLVLLPSFVRFATRLSRQVIK